MKKIILTAATVFAFSFANAQDLKSKKGENYLPEAGEWAIGFNADGLFTYVGNSLNGNTGNAAPSVGYQNAGTFVGKRFITDKTAQRVTANFSFGSDMTTTPIVGGGETKLTDSDFGLSLGLGKEWRKGSTRLQGFYGADLFVIVASSSTKSETSSPGFPTVSTETKSGLGIGLGAQGFIGAEYFLFPKISFGAQYTYGLNILTKGSGSTTTTGSPTVNGASNTNINLGGVGVSSINMTLHF